MVKKEEVAVKEEVIIDKTEAWWGTGRRKTAIARVKVKLERDGQIVVNEKPIDEYFPAPSAKVSFQAPLKAVGRLEDISATIKVRGGGKEAQLGAVVHGLARALVSYDESLRPTLSRGGYLDLKRAQSKYPLSEGWLQNAVSRPWRNLTPVFKKGATG